MDRLWKVNPATNGVPTLSTRRLSPPWCPALAHWLSSLAGCFAMSMPAGLLIALNRFHRAKTALHKLAPSNAQACCAPLALPSLRRSFGPPGFVVDAFIWLAGQPARQPVNEPMSMKSLNQTEFFFPYALPKAKWVDASEVASWATWREAVLWCWENRPEQSMQRNGDQSTFRHYCEKEYGLRVHAPHVSRWLNRDTDAPMDLPPDFVSAFESFTGWHGLTQFFNRKAKTTCLEEVQARMAA